MKTPDGYAPPLHWPGLGKKRPSVNTHIWFRNGAWWAWTPPVGFSSEGSLAGPFRTLRLGAGE